MKRIVVPLIGTPDAEVILEQARAHATLDSEITYLVHVLDSTATYLDTWSSRAEAAQAYLDAIADTFPAGATVETRVLTGEPGKRILEFVRESNATMLMLAPRWSEEQSGFAPDSVSKSLLEGSPVPILLVPPDAFGGSGQFDSVMIPFLGSIASQESLSTVLAWMSMRDFMIRLVALMPGAETNGNRLIATLHGTMENGYYNRQLELAQTNLVNLRALLTQSGIRSTWEVRYGPVVHEILRASGTLGVDLIVFPPLSGDHDALEYVWSTVFRVACQAHVPVLVFPNFRANKANTSSARQAGRNAITL